MSQDENTPSRPPPSIADFDVSDTEPVVTIGDLIVRNTELEARFNALRASHVAVCAERVRLTIRCAKAETSLRELTIAHDRLRTRVARAQSGAAQLKTHLALDKFHTS